MVNEEQNFEAQIGELVGSLKRVEAPGDFDTHVRARIAMRTSAEQRGSWLATFARIAVPAALVLIAGGYVGYRSLDDGGAIGPTMVEVHSSNTLPTAANEELRVRPAVSPVPGSRADDVAGGGRSGSSSPEKITSPAAETRTPGGGSFDLSVRDSKKPLPRGFDPTGKPPANARGIDQTGRIPITAVFDILGLKASWTAGGWRVDSVNGKNVADHSNIKSGDVIEAINDQPVNEKTSFSGKFTGKTIRIRRDGASLEIPFKP